MGKIKLDKASFDAAVDKAQSAFEAVSKLSKPNIKKNTIPSFTQYNGIVDAINSTLAKAQAYNAARSSQMKAASNTLYETDAQEGQQIQKNTAEFK